MAKALIIIGALLFVLGFVAMSQTTDGALRFFPAALLPLNRPFIAGPDLPAHLTNSGIAVVYLLPGAVLLVIGGLLLYGRQSSSLSA
jgi:hypothetical protein